MKTIRFYFDYIDPACRVMEDRVRQVADEFGFHLELVPFEVRKPSDPAIAANDPAWVAWWDRVRPELEAMNLEPTPFERVPLTRKAHELRLHAIEQGCDDELHTRLWEDALLRGMDLARIDLLVRTAESVGLDRTEAKAVLDVDRWTAEIESLRAASELAGVQGVPSLLVGPDLMEGVHDVDRIREFVVAFEPSEG